MRQIILLFSILMMFFQPAMAGGGEDPWKTEVIPRKVDGAFWINTGNFLFIHNNATSLPVFIAPEITLHRKFTAGLMFSFFQFKKKTGNDKGVYFPEGQLKYNHYLLAAKSTLFLNDWIENLLNLNIDERWFDFYISGWAGYNFAGSGNALADPEYIKSEEKLRAGAMLGGRSMLTRNFGLYIEGGYSPYGFGAVGATFVFR